MSGLKLRPPCPMNMGMHDEETFDPTADTLPPPAPPAAGPTLPQDGPVGELLRWAPQARPPAVDDALEAMRAAVEALGLDHHAAKDLSGNVCAILATDREMGFELEPHATALEATRRRRLSDTYADAIAAAWCSVFGG